MPRVTITVPNKTAQPYRFQLDRESVTLGRGSDNDIAIDCGSVSVKHAEMRRIRGGYELRDLGSTNGIKHDGDRLSVIPLRSGMTAHLGDVAFDFLLSDEELEALSREKPADSQDERGDDDGERPARSSGDDSPQRELAVSGGGGFGMILLFLILAAAAFVAGMAVRFQKDTGGSLIEAVRAKVEKGGAPASGKPAAPEPAPAAK